MSIPIPEDCTAVTHVARLQFPDIPDTAGAPGRGATVRCVTHTSVRAPRGACHRLAARTDVPGRTPMPFPFRVAAVEITTPRYRCVYVCVSPPDSRPTERCSEQTTPLLMPTRSRSDVTAGAPRGPPRHAYSSSGFLFHYSWFFCLAPPPHRCGAEPHLRAGGLRVGYRTLPLPLGRYRRVRCYVSPMELVVIAIPLWAVVDSATFGFADHRPFERAGYSSIRPSASGPAAIMFVRPPRQPIPAMTKLFRRLTHLFGDDVTGIVDLRDIVYLQYPGNISGRYMRHGSNAFSFNGRGVTFSVNGWRHSPSFKLFNVVIVVCVDHCYSLVTSMTCYSH